MYRVSFLNNSTEYFDDVVLISKQPNGFFAPCQPAQATGVCLRLPHTFENEEGEDITYLTDTPFIFNEKNDYNGGVSSVEYVETARELSNMTSILNILVGGVAV